MSVYPEWPQGIIQIEDHQFRERQTVCKDFRDVGLLGDGR